MTLKSVLQRLEATKDIKVEAATDLKGAAAFVEKALRKNKLDWKVKAVVDKNDEKGGVIEVDGKTVLGSVNFVVEMDSKGVWFDWFDTSGLDVFEAFQGQATHNTVVDSLAKRDINAARAGLAKVEKVMDRARDGIKTIEAYIKFKEMLLNSVKGR